MSLIESLFRKLRAWIGRAEATSPRHGNDLAQVAAAQNQPPSPRKPANRFEGPSIDLSNEKGPVTLPADLSCDFLNLSGTSITALPSGIAVSTRLILRDCAHLEALPDGLAVGALDLSNCPGLRRLPDGLRVNFLTLDGCRQLSEWPDDCEVSLGALSLRGCHLLDRLPAGVSRLASLDLRDCHLFTSLPEDLVVTSWIDVGGTQIVRVPAGMERAQLRWKGVAVDPRIAFDPSSLTGREILDERNAEVRRVMIERVGLDRFIRETSAEVIDEDEDLGGERRLLRVRLEGDEDLVCVSVICPSTGRNYLIRVPPSMETCHAAVAWTAGFENPDDYRPAAEA